MPTTTTLGLPIPAESDPFGDGALAIRNLANALDRKIIRKPADEIVTNSVALQNDDHFVFSVEAGETYSLDALLVMVAPTSAIDARLGFAFPAGTLSFGVTAMDPAVAAGVVGSGNFAAASAAVSGVTFAAVGVASAETAVRVAGSFLCTASGLLRLMWAQNTATAANLSMKAGSTMKVEVI